MKITIHRALAELKLLDKKIDKAMIELNSRGFVKNGRNLVNGTNLSQEEFISRARGQIDALTSWISRYIMIKSKIDASNSVTKVTIAGHEYTVAEAIMRKNCDYLWSFVEKLKTERRIVQHQFEKANEEVEAQLNKQLEIMGANEKSSNNGMLDFIDGYRNKNGYSLVMPSKLDELIDTLDKQVLEFNSEVDAVLSESNATTFIEIDD